MIPLIRAVVSEGKTVVTLIVDGGPDWSASSLLNSLYFMRLWKTCNLDMLCVTSFAARYSAYNPIEHLWSVLSKKLASVQLSAVATSDDKAPYYISGITDEQRKAKESQVFDDAIEEIADVHWNNAVFDGFSITPVPVKCSDHFASDHDIVSKFLKAPLKEIRDGSTHTVLLEQFRFLFGHVKMHHNEIVFLKCQESTCAHCTNNPVRAKEVFSFLIDRKMKLFYPMPSKEHKDHYYTFLDMCTKKPEELPNADTHLPSYDKNLGNCPHCPDVVFLSKTAKKRHLQVFHPKRRSVVRKKSSQSAEKRLAWKCNHQLCSGAVCGQMFGTLYQLRKHRKIAKHQANRKRISAAMPDSEGDNPPPNNLSDSEEPNPLPGDMSDSEGDNPPPGDMSDSEAENPPPSNMSDFEGDNLPSDTSDLEEAVTVLPAGHSRGAKTVTVLPPSEIKSYVTTATTSDEGAEKCIVCELGEDEDEEMEVWIECTQCFRWVHESCLLPNYPFKSQDNDFICPDCYRRM
jgi:hypothetical protein